MEPVQLAVQAVLEGLEVAAAPDELVLGLQDPGVQLGDPRVQVLVRPTLLVHVVAGALALVSGFVALSAAKGLKLHRKSGLLFVGAMVLMGLSGAVIATMTGEPGSVTGGLLATYLVVTALTTVRPPAAGSRLLSCCRRPCYSAIRTSVCREAATSRAAVSREQTFFERMGDS